MRGFDTPPSNRTQQRHSGVPLLAGLAATVVLALASGCAHRRQRAYTPPPPPLESAPGQPAPGPAPVARERRPNPALTPDEEFVATHSPIFTETGMASWYGTVYNHRAAADGKIYDENELSAANRTLPMGSLIRVTYLRTGKSAIVRITDRGPFVAGRILDLSEGAARKIGMLRAGIGEVRMDVYSAPEPLNSGGRWCVQIGAFSRRGAALHLEARLRRQYRSANVIEFRGPTGYWVRIRPYDGSRRVADSIIRRVHPKQGEAWLVRLD